MDLEPLPIDDQDAFGAESPTATPMPPPGSVFSRGTKLAAAGLAVAVVAGAAFAWGTTYRPTSTVRLMPAMASSSPPGPRPGGPGHGPGEWNTAFAGGIVGTVSSPDFTVALPVHPRKKPPSATATPAAVTTTLPSTVTPLSPTTSTAPTVTVDTSKTTTYEDIKNGPVSDAVIGDRIVAMGRRATDGDLTATVIRILPPPPAAPTQPAAPTASTGTVRTDAATTASPALTGPPPPLLTKAPFVIGVVATNDGSTITVTTRGGATQTITTGPATVVVETAPGSFGDVAPGELVTVRGRRQAKGTIDAASVTVVITGTKDAGSAGLGSGLPGVGPAPRPGSGPPPGGGKGDNDESTTTTSPTA